MRAAAENVKKERGLNMRIKSKESRKNKGFVSILIFVLLLLLAADAFCLLRRYGVLGGTGTRIGQVALAMEEEAEGAIQVIFTQEVEVTEEQRDDGTSFFESRICRATVDVPGREDAQEAIRKTLDEIYQAHQTYSAELLTNARNSSIESSYASQYEGCFVGAYVSGQALSLEDYTLSYASGAVHESSERNQYNFDLESGAVLSLGDIVTDAAALETLVLTEMSDDRETIESYTGTELETVVEKALDPEKTTGWYLDADGFHLFFNSYEIAPYFIGTSDYLVSYNSLSGVVSEEYIPVSGDFSIDSEAVQIVSVSEAATEDSEGVYGVADGQECVLSTRTVYDLYIMSSAAAEKSDGTGLLSDTVMICYASVMSASDQIYLAKNDG